MAKNNHQNAQTIIEKLKKHFKVKTDTGLAECLGVSQSTLATWKSRNAVNYKKIIDKCDEVDLNWLFREDPPQAASADWAAGKSGEVSDQGLTWLSPAGELSSLRREILLLRELLAEKDARIDLLKGQIEQQKKDRSN